MSGGMVQTSKTEATTSSTRVIINHLLHQRLQGFWKAWRKEPINLTDRILGLISRNRTIWESSTGNGMLQVFEVLIGRTGCNINRLKASSISATFNDSGPSRSSAAEQSPSSNRGIWEKNESKTKIAGNRERKWQDKSLGVRESVPEGGRTRKLIEWWTLARLTATMDFPKGYRSQQEKKWRENASKRRTQMN